MPLYQYDSFSRRGSRIKGTIDASSLQTAKEILRGQGLMPVSLTEATVEATRFSWKSFFEKQVDLRTKINFTKQLSILLRSGVPLLQALELLIDQFEGRLKRVLVNIKDGVKAGESFASQLANYPKIFPKVYVQLVKAGEASGKLDILLDRLTSYLEKTEETEKRIKKAIAYPLLLLSFSLLVLIGMLTVLVPRIESMFSKMKKELPAPTEFLIFISNFTRENFIILTVLFLSVIVFFVYWRSTKAGRYKLDSIFLRLPVVSYFARTRAVVQFCKTLGMLVESGVILSEALDIVCNIVDNQVLSFKLQEARDKIIKEGKISKYLKQTGIFPSIASYMISTGEQSGKLDVMLLTVGNDYEVELNENIDRLTSKIGPAMTIVMGVIVGFLLVSIFMPIMEMGDISGI
ncbi:MAG: type II secretion system F family protein [bacterium]